MSGALRGRGWLLAVGVLIAAMVFGLLQDGGEEGRSPGRESTDTTPFGFAAWAQLLSDSGQRVQPLEAAPSETTIDPAATVIGLDLGDLAEEDVAALRDFVAGGGYLITGGNTDEDAIREITGLDAETGGSAASTLVPLLPVPQTEGVDSVDGAGAKLFAEPGGGLPVLGSDEGALLLLGGGEERGRVALLSSSDPLANERLTFADNAQFAIDLGRGAEPERPVLFLESLARTEASGEGAAGLPSGWTTGFGVLALAALTLVLSRVRRLGPPDGSPTPTARPRADYVDALARVLARRGDLKRSAEPVRTAAIEGIARRSGGEPATEDADMLAAQAERAGVPAEEAAALDGPLAEPEQAIRAARALARTRS